MYFVLVSASLSSFCVVLSGFGLVLPGLAAFRDVFRCFLLVSACLAAFVWFCLVLAKSLLVSAGLAVFCWFCVVLGWFEFMQFGPKTPVKSDMM